MEKPTLGTDNRQLQTVLKKYWFVPVIILTFIVLFLAGSWYGQKKAISQNAAGNRRILYYVDPMNPAHTSPEPGLAPCGMKMEPVYAEDENQSSGAALAPGSVKITPKKQQIIGVKVATVTKSPWTYTLRTVGKVAADETRIYRINAFIDGFIMKVFDNSTGALVRKDEPLATYYSKDLFTALQTYYYAVYAIENLKYENFRQGDKVPLSQKHYLEAQKQAAEYNLMALGVSPQQIRELVRNKDITQEIVINAPVTSFVLVRNVSPGQKFSAGEELYRLADLSKVWIQADLFKDEANYVHPGEKVKVNLAGQTKTFTATVTEILPEFDPATLTLKVRLELDNPGFTLRPGMFVDVEFPITMPPTVNIPVDAVMDSGLKKIVFVDRGHGFFEPRRVQTGWRLGERTQITGGLKPGERIVVSGNFLIDSESRMRLAAAGMFGEVTRDPVCGLNVDESRAKAAGFRSTYQDHDYYFCSPECKGHFDKNPGRYAAKPGETGKKAAGSSPPPAPSHQMQMAQAKPQPQAKPQTQAAQAKLQPQPQTNAPVKAKILDPVCGREVDVTQAQANGLTSVYQGKTYYFSSFSCNRQFDKDPEQYLSQKAPGGSGGSPAQVAAGKALDPVCGLPVAAEAAQKAGRTSEYQGKLYYFDTAGCKERFDRDPEHYLSGSKEVAKTYKYPEVPTNPDILLRLRRDSIRAIPAGKGQSLVEKGKAIKLQQNQPLLPPNPPIQIPGNPSPPPQPQVLRHPTPQPPPPPPTPQAQAPSPAPPSPGAGSR